MGNGGIVRDKPMKKGSFALEDLQLAKGMRRRKFENVLNFERVKNDTIFRHNEVQNLAYRNEKVTLTGVEVNVVLVTSKEDGTQIMNLLRPKLGMGSEIV